MDSKRLEETKRCCTVCDSKKVCHVCGTQTLYACSDCQIDVGATVYVCNKTECRDAHEQKCPSMLISRLRALSLPLDAEKVVDKASRSLQSLVAVCDPPRFLADRIQAALSLLSPALARVKELEREAESYAQLQARCFDGFPTHSSVFDRVKELEALYIAVKSLRNGLDTHEVKIYTDTQEETLANTLNRIREALCMLERM